MQVVPRHTTVLWALWALVIGLIAIYLVLFALTAATRLARPLEELTYGESWLLDGARQVANGEGLYAAPDHLPLMQIAYTPVYYAVVGGLIRVLGDSGYSLGRCISLIATLVGAGALAWSIRRITQSWRYGALAAGLLLTQNVTLLLWASLERVDALALALTLVALALFTEGLHVAAALVFVLAFFTKQTYVVAPLAAAVALWPCRGAMVRFGVIYIAAVGIGIGLAQWLTQGWFWWHVVTANANPPDLDTFSTLVGSFLQFNGLPLLAALLALLLPLPAAARAWRVYLLLGVLELGAVAKIGASSNYWLELSASMAALLALGAHCLSRTSSVALVAPAMLAGALLIAVPAYQATATDIGDTLVDISRPPGPRYLSLIGDVGLAPYRADAGFIDEIAHEPGDLLTDNSGLAVAARKRIQYEFQIFQLLRVEGLWSEEPILDAIAARRFSLVALMHPLDGTVAAEGNRWSPAIQSALEANYQAVGPDSGFWLYRPRN